MKGNSCLVLIRHGQSTYNKQNLFTGWKDVKLTKKGVREAHEAAPLVANITFTHAFTSDLKRARDTLAIILKDIQQDIPITEDLALNERDYGSLVGQNKSEASEKYGADQVQIWRRSYATPPPEGESLEMTAKRSIPYFQDKIEPLLAENNNIIVSAHGNSIRSIVMHLHNLNSEQILETEIGWCEPWIYSFDNGEQTDFKIISRSGSLSQSYLPETSKSLI